MDIELTPYEIRVIGCLIEKSITTPDQYPLSLNALVNACNQKSNRHPVLALDEITVQETIDQLMKKHFVLEKSGFGSRVVKYAHRFCNTEFGSLKFTDQQLAIICELFLRGPQTPGELRTHGNRMCGFHEVSEVESALHGLLNDDNGPYVVRLEREPGRRESRYQHLFGGEVITTPVAAAPQSGSHADPASGDRISALEAEVAELRAELRDMRAMLDDLTS